MTSYGDLNPEEVPLLILNGFEYVTQWSGDPYAVPLRADTSKPKLTQQDVTDLIAYLNKGGSVLIMENVMSNLKEESASSFVRLLDAAGLSMALNKSVVNNDPQGYPNRVRSAERLAFGFMNVIRLWKVRCRTPLILRQAKLPGNIRLITNLIRNRSWKLPVGKKRLMVNK